MIESVESGRFDTAEQLLGPEALERWQLEHVNTVIDRARETDYYRTRLSDAPARLETLANLRELPVTRKEDVLADIAANPPFGTRLRVAPSAIRQIVETSGTTGAGQEVYPLDAEDEGIVHAMAARGFAWAGVKAGSAVLNTLPLATSAAGQWYYHAFRLLGANVLEVGTLPTERKIGYVQRFGADTVVGTPSYLYRLAVEARRMGIDPTATTVERLIVAGESWSPPWMRRLEEEWGARAFEQYGCTQRGMAWTCPAGAVTDGARGVLHALSEFGVYEVIDPETGAPVQEGSGELVLTPFASSASPLVRFATGDCVTLVSGCECGRPGPTLAAGRVERYDFMVKVRGVNVWPEALDRAVFAVQGVSEYEASVEIDGRGREHLRVKVELLDAADHVTETVAARIRETTGLSASVEIVDGREITSAIEDRFRKRRRLFDRRRPAAGPS